MADPDADFDALMAEMGKLQDEIGRRERLGPRQPALPGLDALQCPDPDRPP